MLKMYAELAGWWHLLSAPEDYADEAAFFLRLLEPVTGNRAATLLELGSGGGNNATHMKSAFAAVTLVDLSPFMLEASRRLNPDCEHVVGDMGTVRLGREFDAVFIHDAIDYMTSAAALRAALETAFIHCKAGGMAVIVPDHVRETFGPSTGHGGHDGVGRALRYLEWTYDPDPADSTIATDFVYMLREGAAPVRIEYEQHVTGLFPLAVWERTLQEVGFAAAWVIDEEARHVFIGRK